jgi:hypothetical protein
MSFDEIRKKYDQEKDAEGARRAEEMKDALRDLRKNSVRKITVEYDGHNDEGFVNRIAFLTSGGKEVEKGMSPVQMRADPSLFVIEEFVLSLLPEAWETNEGGFGTCVIDAETGDYDLKHIWGPGKPQERR